MKEIFRTINRLNTAREDVARHVMGAVYSAWMLIVIYTVAGKIPSLIGACVCVAFFVYWEIHNSINENRSVSVTNILGSVVTIAPLLITIIQN